MNPFLLVAVLITAEASEYNKSKDLEELQQLVNILENELKLVQEENVELVKESAELRRLLHEKELRKRQTQRSHKIAFTALITSGSLQRLKAHTTIVFDNAITNVGSAYDSFTGRFAAPVSGTYVFAAGVQCLYHQLATFEFARDGISVMPVHCDSRGMDGTESSSRTLAIHLNRGQEFWLRSTGNNGDDSIWGHKFSDFTGFLLFED